MAFLLAVALGRTTASAQSVQYYQDFDSRSAPDLPAGWSAPEGAWTTSTSVASPGSGANNAENKGSSAGSLISPVFDFSLVTAGELSYSARRTSTYDSLNLSVEASIDGGSSWTIVLLDSTASLAIAASTYSTVTVPIPPSLYGETAVRLRFVARSNTGGNLRIDDVALVADGPVSWNRFGFAAVSSSALEGSDSLVVPIGIHLIPSSDNLQGLQFSLDLSAGLSFVGVGVGLSNLTAPSWHVSHEVVDASINVVALAEGTVGLSPVSTDSLFLVYLSTIPLQDPASRTDSIRIRDVVSSAASATGEDLFLAVDPLVHITSVLPRAATISIDPTQIDIGVIAQDSIAQASIGLANIGTGVLEVLDMYSISGLLGITPAFLTLEPDSSAFVVVAVDGALYGLGALQDWMVIEHNGSSSPDTVSVIGTVVSSDTRGDANGDGFVDIIDLVLGIDHILARIDLAEMAARLDLHPFPGGNGSVDVRDLTVLAQGIARGIWPDDVPLPSLAPAMAKGASVVGDLIVSQDLDAVRLWARTAEPIRALHVIARGSSVDAKIAPHPDLPMAQVGVPYRSYGPRSFSLLAFSMGESIVPSGRRVLLATIEGAASNDLVVISALAVDRSLNRRTLTAVTESVEVPAIADGMVFAPPYPNPVDPQRSALVHFPVALSEDESIQVTVTDILGRSVRSLAFAAKAGTRVATWNLTNSSGSIVTPGLYFVTLSSTDRSVTHSLTVR